MLKAGCSALLSHMSSIDYSAKYRLKTR